MSDNSNAAFTGISSDESALADGVAARANSVSVIANSFDVSGSILATRLVHIRAITLNELTDKWTKAEQKAHGKIAISAAHAEVKAVGGLAGYSRTNFYLAAEIANEFVKAGHLPANIMPTDNLAAIVKAVVKSAGGVDGVKAVWAEAYKTVRPTTAPAPNSDTEDTEDTEDTSDTSDNTGGFEAGESAAPITAVAALYNGSFTEVPLEKIDALVEFAQDEIARMRHELETREEWVENLIDRGAALRENAAEQTA